MSSSEQPPSVEGYDIRTAIRLARLVLYQPSVALALGQNYKRTYGRPVGNLIQGNWAKVPTGYDVDVSAHGIAVTPYGLDYKIADRITERTAIGVHRSAYATLHKNGWPVYTSLTEYQNAFLRTAEGEVVPVVRREGKIVSPLLSRHKRFKPEIWHGTEVIASDDPDDSLYVLSAESPSSDGRGPNTIRAEVTFSPREILGYATAARTTAERGRAVNQQQGLNTLTDYLLRLSVAELE